MQKPEKALLPDTTALKRKTRQKPVIGLVVLTNISVKTFPVDSGNE